MAGMADSASAKQNKVESTCCRRIFGINTLLLGIVVATVVFSYVVFATIGFAHAEETSHASSEQDSEFSKVSGDEIQNNPKAQRILSMLEETKKRIQELQNRQHQGSEHEKWLDQQRAEARERLQQDLKGFNKKYDDFSPKKSFSRFLNNKVNATHHDIFWDQFKYMDTKVGAARAAKTQVLENGGSYKDARQIYNKIASTPRKNLVEIITQLNIKYGHADKVTQQLFNENGKMPRFEQAEDGKGKVLCIPCGQKDPDKLVVSEKEFDKQAGGYQIQYYNGTAEAGLKEIRSIIKHGEKPLNDSDKDDQRKAVVRLIENHLAQKSLDIQHLQGSSDKQEPLKYRDIGLAENKDPIAVLNMRLAKGEITVNQYHEIKKIIKQE